MSGRLTLKAKNATTLVLAGLDEFLAELVRSIPDAGTPHPDSEARLFPSLSGGREPGWDEEWRELVRPELEAQFSWNRDRVAEDLKGLRKMAGQGLALEIPLAHVPAWVHALNQARQSLVARHRIQEETLEDVSGAPGAASLQIFQTQFYGLLQEWLMNAGDCI